MSENNFGVRGFLRLSALRRGVCGGARLAARLRRENCRRRRFPAFARRCGIGNRQGVQVERRGRQDKPCAVCHALQLRPVRVGGDEVFVRAVGVGRRAPFAFGRRKAARSFRPQACLVLRRPENRRCPAPQRRLRKWLCGLFVREPRAENRVRLEPRGVGRGVPAGVVAHLYMRDAESGKGKALRNFRHDAPRGRASRNRGRFYRHFRRGKLRRWVVHEGGRSRFRRNQFLARWFGRRGENPALSAEKRQARQDFGGRRKLGGAVSLPPPPHGQFGVEARRLHCVGHCEDHGEQARQALRENRQGLRAQKRLCARAQRKGGVLRRRRKQKGRLVFVALRDGRAYRRRGDNFQHLGGRRLVDSSRHAFRHRRSDF